jgi:DNA mismatch repair protein MutS
MRAGGLPHLARPTIVRRGDVLPLDEMTRRNLELVEPLRAGAEGATLLDVIDRTLTPMGGRLLRRWLLAPLVEPAAITARLDAVETLLKDGRGRERLREALDGVRDLERLAGRAALGRATPRELGALRDSIQRLPDVAGAHTLSLTLDLLADIGADLARALVERPPAQLDEGDAIQAGYDRELDDLKATRDGGKQYIAALQARERERTGIGSLKVGFNKVFGSHPGDARTATFRSTSRPSSSNTKPKFLAPRSGSQPARRKSSISCGGESGRRSPACRRARRCWPSSTSGPRSPTSRSASATCVLRSRRTSRSS